MKPAALVLTVLLAAAAPAICIAQQDRPMTVEEMEQAFGLKPASPAGEAPKRPRFRGPTIELGGPSGDPAPLSAAPASAPTPGVFSLRVEFDLNSARLAPQYVAQMQEVALFMQRNPQITVTVRGHTDATGDAGHNQILSEQRAAAVRDFLIQRGVSGDRLAADGRGETSILPTERPDSPRNRRVEFLRTDTR